ncbi:hypothetical protein Sbs19_40320 [Sphingobium sp. BS19]|nr:hypothetical protein Sbs19_40320 [Sphingobium sp. BS19]
MARLTTNQNPELEAIGSDIVKRLGGVWKPGGAMCLCPAHADRSPSLSVRVGDHALLFKCFGGCDTREAGTDDLATELKASRTHRQPCSIRSVHSGSMDCLAARTKSRSKR